MIVLSSQEVSDFLREGPARVTDLHGNDLQVVLGIGTIAAPLIVLGALWTQTFALRVAIAAVALAGGDANRGRPRRRSGAARPAGACGAL